MTDQDFYSEAKESLLEGAKLCLKNAAIHRACAEQCVLIGNFGIGNSLLILASEECIKCMILTAGYFSVPLPFPIRPFFKHHWVKHNQAAEMHPLMEGLFHLGEHLKSLFKEREASNFGFAFDVTFSVATYLIFQSVGEKLASEFGNKNEPLEDKTNFWKEAGNNKNNGFYVDFENGRWIVPASFDENEYDRTLKMVSPFLSLLEFIEGIKPNDYKEISFVGLNRSEDAMDKGL